MVVKRTTVWIIRTVLCNIWNTFLQTFSIPMLTSAIFLTAIFFKIETMCYFATLNIQMKTFYYTNRKIEYLYHLSIILPICNVGLHVFVPQSHSQSPLHQRYPCPCGQSAHVTAVWLPQLIPSILKLKNSNVKIFKISHKI